MLVVVRREEKRFAMLLSVSKYSLVPQRLHNTSFILIRYLSDTGYVHSGNMMRLSNVCSRPFALLWISTSQLSFFTARAYSLQQRLVSSSSRTERFLPKLSIAPSVRSMTSRTKNAAAADSGTSSNDNMLRVALCQFHVTDDKSANIQTCAEYLDRAAAQGAQLVVLPEIWNSQYVPDCAEPNDESTTLSTTTTTPVTVSKSPSVDLIRTKAMQHGLWIVGGSIPERDEAGNLFNTCVVYSPTGTLVAKHRKVHLFDIDVPGGITFFESDTLSPGSTVSSFATPWCHVGVGICYDIRFPEYAMLLAKTCKILIYPGAFNMVTGPAHWELLQRGRAVDNQCFVLTASPARSPPPPPTATSDYPHYTAWGHSTAVAPWGDVIATTDETAGIVLADLELDKVDTMRRNIPVRDQKRSDLYNLEQL
jgi:omega-amidase